MTTPPDSRDGPAATGSRVARIVVAGAAGMLGSALLERLDAHSDEVAVVAVDRRRVGGPAAERLVLDVLTDDLGSAFAGADVVVHLAGSRDCGPDDPTGRVAVEGTRRVLAAATSAGVGRVVRPSSTAVYGAWANNPPAIDEDAPIRPAPGFAPAAADAECERLLAAWEHSEAGRTVSRLRLAPVVGGTARSALAEAALGRSPVRIRGAAPAGQVLHIEDATAALAAAVFGALPGVWNVAADGVLDPARRERGPRVPGLSEAAAARAIDACWSSGRFAAAGSVVPYLVHPFVVDTTRIRTAGVVPEFSADAAAAGAGAGPGRFVAAARAAAGVLGAEASRIGRRARGATLSRPIGG